MGGFGAARRAYREHKRVLELDPRRKDAGLIVGMYRYAVSRCRGIGGSLAGLAGFDGGRERGIALIEAAAAYPSDVQANALFTLVVIYNREGRYDDALRAIGSCSGGFRAIGCCGSRPGRRAARRQRAAPLTRWNRASGSWPRTPGRGPSAKRRAGDAYGAALAGLGRGEQHVIDDSHARRPAGDRHGCAPGVAIATAPATAFTDDSLMATFDSDMRAVVYRWAADDPRPEAERRRALFDFVYQTYDSSAWIPQSLFDSNLVTQAVVGDVDTIVRDKAGLVLWRDNAGRPGVRHGAEFCRPASRSSGRSTASSATRRRSTASRISAPARRCSTTCGSASR